MKNTFGNSQKDASDVSSTHGKKKPLTNSLNQTNSANKSESKHLGLFSTSFPVPSTSPPQFTSLEPIPILTTSTSALPPRSRSQSLSPPTLRKKGVIQTLKDFFVNDKKQMLKPLKNPLKKHLFALNEEKDTKGMIRLSDRLKSRVTPENFFQWAVSLAIALEFMHDNCLAHGAVNCSNVWVSPNTNQVVLANFTQTHATNGSRTSSNASAQSFSGVTDPDLPSYAGDVFCFASLLSEILLALLDKKPPAHATQSNLLQIFRGLPGSFLSILEEAWSTDQQSRPNMKDILGCLETMNARFEVDRTLFARAQVHKRRDSYSDSDSIEFSFNDSHGSKLHLPKCTSSSKSSQSGSLNLALQESIPSQTTSGSFVLSQNPTLGDSFNQSTLAPAPPSPMLKRADSVRMIQNPSHPPMQLFKKLTDFGKIAENFSLSSFLGTGSFSVVMLAYRRSPQNEKVAIKIAFPSLKRNPSTLIQEAQLHSQLHHKNILNFLDIESTPEALFFVLEFAPKGSLCDLLIQTKGLPEIQVQQLAAPLLSALVYLETQEIAHRDFKPENILLKQEQGSLVPLLSDFGLAARCNKNKLLTNPSGSPYYLAPEVLDTKGYYYSCDWWAFGVTLYTLIAYEFPFFKNHEETNFDLYERIRLGKFGFHSSKWNHVSRSLKDLISQLLTVRVDRRLTPSDALNHSWFSI